MGITGADSCLVAGHDCPCRVCHIRAWRNERGPFTRLVSHYTWVDHVCSVAAWLKPWFKNHPCRSGLRPRSPAMGRKPKKNHRPDLNGLMVIDKPLGLTSMDVLRQLKRVSGGAKKGHAGARPTGNGRVGLLLCALQSRRRTDGWRQSLPHDHRLECLHCHRRCRRPREEVAVTEPQPALPFVQC